MRDLENVTRAFADTYTGESPGDGTEPGDSLLEIDDPDVGKTMSDVISTL